MFRKVKTYFELTLLTVVGILLLCVPAVPAAAEEITIIRLEQAGADYVYLEWTEYKSADGYSLYRSGGEDPLDFIKNVEDCSTYNYGLESGRSYTYVIRPYILLLDGTVQYLAESPGASIQIGVKSPENLTVNAAGSTAVSLHWDGDPLADYYLLYRSPDNRDWSLVKSVYGTETVTYGLEQGKSWYFRVRAVRDVNGILRYSDYCVSDVYSLGIDSPEWLSVRIAGSSSVLLEWEGVDGAAGYRLYRSENGGDFQLIKTVSGTSTGNYQLDSTADYVYRIAAIREDNGYIWKSDYVYSESVRLSLDTVEHLQVDRVFSGGVSLSWNPVEHAEGYRLYRTGEDGATVLVKTVSDNTTSTYSLAKGEVYRFTVKAVGQSGSVVINGSLSEPAAVFLTDLPELSFSQREEGLVHLSWSESAGADLYRLRIAEAGGKETVSEIQGTEMDYETDDFQEISVSLCAVRQGVESSLVTGTYVPEDSDPTYRALLIGEENYSPVLNGPLNDLDAMDHMLSGLTGMNWEIYQQSDATLEEIIGLINLAFADATEDDVSLFYYSGHGVTNSGDYYAGALVTVDYEYLPMQELAELLSAIPGKVVVLLDSCGSGAAISDDSESADPYVLEGLEPFDPEKFNSLVVQAFSEYQDKVQSKSAELANDKFYVLTSSAYEQNSRSLSVNGIWGGVFTRALVKSAGYDFNTKVWEDTMYADVDGDGILSLNECYLYCRDAAVSYQDVQVYPANSSAKLFFRK